MCAREKPIYAKVTSQKMAAILMAETGAKSEEKMPSRDKVLCWLIPQIHDGRYYESRPIEQQWVEEFTDEWQDAHPEAEILELEAFQFLQLSQKRIADELFKGQKTTAKRAIEELVNKGIITLVKKGVKGHGSLYLWDVTPMGGNAMLHGFNPVPSEEASYDARAEAQAGAAMEHPRQVQASSTSKPCESQWEEPEHASPEPPSKPEAEPVPLEAYGHEEERFDADAGNEDAKRKHETISPQTRRAHQERGAEVNARYEEFRAMSEEWDRNCKERNAFWAQEQLP